MRTVLRRLQSRDDAGLSLLEVVIAMLVFAIVSIAAIHSLTSVLSVTRDSRNREIASNLASQEVDLARDASNIFNLLDFTKDIVLNGETFTVVRATEWVKDSTAITSCGQGGGGILRYKQVGIKVTWEHMRPGSQAITAFTVISPNTKINNPQLGTILVSVKDADGNGAQGVTVSAVPAPTPNGAQSLTATPAATDIEGCSYILQVAPGNYTVTVSKTNYIEGDQTTTASMEVPVTAANATSASFAYDLKARYSLAYYSNPAPLAMMPRSLETTYFNSKANWSSTASGSGFSRSIDLFPWGEGYTFLAGKYAQANDTDDGCLSTNPGEWLDGTRSGDAVVGVEPDRVTAAAGGTASTVVGMGLVQVSSVTNMYLRATSVDPSLAGPGDPGCDVGMVYRTDKATLGTIFLALPYGTWKLEKNSADIATGWVPINNGDISTVTPGGDVGSLYFVLDPRVVAP